jgi:hypothetical protein
MKMHGMNDGNNNLQTALMKQPAEVAQIASQKVGHECAETGQLVTGQTGQIMQLHEALKDMSYQQLYALAVSWNKGRNFRDRGNMEEMYAICSEMIDFMIEMLTNPQENEEIRRRIITERFFGDQRPERRSPSRRGRHIAEACDSDGEAPAQKPARARSSSPRVDLSAQHFECPICFDSVPSRSTFVMPCCGYEACRGCAKRTIEAHMEENRRMECIECHSSFNRLGDDFMRQIAELVGPMSFIATKIKLALTSVPACRQCSRCNRIQLVNEEISETFPAVACKACGHAFCFEHGDAHAGYPCPRPTQEQITSEEQISRVCKRCPGCKMPTQKNGGCAHMSCALCGCSWCWTCAKPRCGSGEDRTELLSTWRDDSTNWLSTLLFLVIRFLAGPNSVFYGAVTCQCDAEARNSYDDIQWENRAGGSNRMRWLLIRAVALRCRLRHASGCECLLVAYAVYISGYLMFNFSAKPAVVFAGRELTWALFTTLRNLVNVTDQILQREENEYRSRPFDFALAVAVGHGICVAVLTSRIRPALRELIRKRRWLRVLDTLLCDGSLYSGDVPIICRVIRGAVAFVATLHFSARLLGHSWPTPGQPNRHIWMMEFWLVWLLNQLYMAWLHKRSRNYRGFAWSFFWGYMANCSYRKTSALKCSVIWGALGMLFKLVLTLILLDHHVGLSAVAATATLGLGFSLGFTINR